MDSEDNFIRIDKNNLDDEWNKQDELYTKYALIEADARDKLNEAKAKLELVEAQIYAKIRKNPSEFGLSEKPNEGTIDKAVVRHAKYQEAVKELNQAYSDVNHAAIGPAALEHRKKALENLVQLFLSSYWSKPRIKGRMYDNDEAKMQARRQRKLEEENQL
jgi:hypothetical protein